MLPVNTEDFPDELAAELQLPDGELAVEISDPPLPLELEELLLQAFATFGVGMLAGIKSIVCNGHAQCQVCFIHIINQYE
jgi:hypothetical protein